MTLLYIHHTSCISPQQSFPHAELEHLNLPVDNKLEVSEPAYDEIPAGILRRMGKAIRIGVGSAMPLLKKATVNGIIIGTANGGMEDCIKFLNQIIDYDEGRLTPGNFVGSTPNAIAAQLGLLTSNKGYNITHVQSGLSFENALLDAAMMIENNKEHSYFVGGLDEISAYNYNIDWLAGWYKKEPINNGDFYELHTPGTIAGEGAAMFVVNGIETGAIARLDAIHFFHTTDANEVSEQIKLFLAGNGTEAPDIFLTGENGDSRFLEYFTSAEACLPGKATVARFKHMTGEFATSTAIACCIASEILQSGKLPEHMIKREGSDANYQRILIYNCYKERQHSLILLSSPNR